MGGGAERQEADAGHGEDDARVHRVLRRGHRRAPRGVGQREDRSVPEVLFGGAAHGGRGGEGVKNSSGRYPRVEEYLASFESSCWLLSVCPQGNTSTQDDVLTNHRLRQSTRIGNSFPMSFRIPSEIGYSWSSLILNFSN